MMYQYGNSFGGPWGASHMFGFGFGILGLFFWIFVIFIFVRMLKNANHHYDKNHGKDPIDILKERYAKGEINKEQFESMKKDLS